MAPMMVSFPLLRAVDWARVRCWRCASGSDPVC